MDPRKKPEEQVLKELALDHIEFAIGSIRWLTRSQMEELVADLKSSRPKGTIRAKSDNRKYKKRPLEHMYTLHIDDWDLKEIYRMARSKRHGHKFTVRNLSQFYNLDDAFQEAKGIDP